MKHRNVLIMVVGIIISIISFSAFAQDVHSVHAEKALYLRDGDTGQWYNTVKGTCTMNWSDQTRNGFFHAVAYPQAGTLLTYEFELVAISNSNDSYIEGFWDITKNGVLVCEGCVGKAYGIDAPIDQYFKLYVGDDSQNNDNTWHFSAYVTDRLDY
ncbi:MAG: hypothetical protein JXR76_21810 [Deltaproteobacteria bacterium]|nr:hypothetical protein [Deltaproteobacteria bacterium]